jgi:hypothetical protein
VNIADDVDIATHKCFVDMDFCGRGLRGHHSLLLPRNNLKTSETASPGGPGA